MARHNVTHAKDIFRGKGYHQARNSGSRGVPAMILTKVTYSSAIAADTAALVTLTAAASGAQVVALTTMPAVATTSDFPTGIHGRVVSFTIGTAIGAACTATISGLDVYGNTISDRIIHDGSATIKFGQKAFAVVSAISLESTATSSFSMGHAARFGLPYRLTDVQDVNNITYSATISGTVSIVAGLAHFTGADTGTVSAASGDPRGLFRPSTAPDGSNQFTVWYYVHDTDDAYGIRLGAED